MQTVQLDEIIRQKDPLLKSAVIDAAHGRSIDALAKITEVAEIPDNEARWQRIVKDYMAMPLADRNETLVVSGTNKARQAINALVRESEQRVGTGKTTTHSSGVTRRRLSDGSPKTTTSAMPSSRSGTTRSLGWSAGRHIE